MRVLDGGVPAEQRLAVVIHMPVLGKGAGLGAAVLRAFRRAHPVQGGTGLGERQQGGIQVLVLGAAVAALFEPVLEEDLEAGFLTPVGRSTADAHVALPRSGRDDLPQRRGHVPAQGRTQGDQDRQALGIVPQRGHHQIDVIVTVKMTLEHELPPLTQQTPALAPRRDVERSALILHQGSDFRPAVCWAAQLSVIRRPK
ncbi:hypothetical protein [Streptomyces sp. NPDC127039]|uniref:hypothetical protein n=1 Tax=Streptomyces sp. NPDC127039 TaxID=3347115 RepID=UPI00364E3760